MEKYLFKDGEEIKKYQQGQYSENQCTGGTPISNGEYYSGDTPKVFDGSTATDWVSLETRNYTKDTSWIGYEFSSSIHVKKIFITNGTKNTMPLSVGVERWEESSGLWEEVLRISGYSIKGSAFEIELPDSSPSNRWRMIARDRIDTNAGGDRWRVYEIEMFEYQNGGWNTVGLGSELKEYFDSDGMSDLSLITNEAIQQLQSDQVELLCWTDEVSASRISLFNSVPKGKLIFPKEDIGLNEAGSMAINSTKSGSSTEIKVLASSDRGLTWMGKTQVDTTDLASVKANGFTPEEFNALTKDKLTTLFPNGTARFAFYLEQENLTDVVEIQSLTINEKKYTISPTVSDISVIYEVLKSEQPRLFISRDDGVTWKEVSQDEMVSLSDQPDGNQLRVKALLADRQEVQAISYSWA